ncbi:MAG: bifunctional oligoribonuclease/PAP phosphatase NrnA [Lachnospiraceae bacterium]|nr:bifunctional oligoribonuclease/PAP phosphatase NrnA [Lachnospiraceae bacterium]
MTFNLMELVEGAESIAIAAHVRPDGDAVGSTLALYNYLKKTCPEKEITLYLDRPEAIYSALKGYDEVQDADKGPKDKIYDLFFALDLGDRERLGASVKYFDTAKDTACIDHHVSNKGFARHDYIDPCASSTAELVYLIIDEDKLDREIAECIYVGIIHDTGVLQYQCTTPRTLEIVSKLIKFGFNFPEIIQKTFYEKTYLQNQILGRALIESILFMDGRCIASVVNHKVMDFYGATSADFDGIVNQLLRTKGVDCAIFMYESSREQHLFKVSLRSSERVDVARIAARFGGGGHIRAAGFSMNGTYHDIINNVSAEVEKQLSALETEE